MNKIDFSEFCSHGGCTSKLNPEFLSEVLAHIPKKKDDNLIIGYDSSDDGAVYKISEDIALVKTLDFFKPMVKDPYLFGKIAAANALSDIYAMGGTPKVALNIVCFSEKMSPKVLMDMLKGGAEKVHEAGAVLSGGHSVNDEEPKYGLSVTGIVDPRKIKPNNGCKIGDKIILTKPLGVGIVLAANNMGACPEATFKSACNQMETLNKYAAEICFKYEVNGITDVTGFGFLGHLNEMVPQRIADKCDQREHLAFPKGKVLTESQRIADKCDQREQLPSTEEKTTNTKEYSIIINSNNVPIIDGVKELTKEFYITAAGQKNRNYLKGKVKFEEENFVLEEILYDPQTSGGLLISVSKNDCDKMIEELKANNICSNIVGEVVERKECNIIVKGGN